MLSHYKDTDILNFEIEYALELYNDAKLQDNENKDWDLWLSLITNPMVGGVNSWEDYKKTGKLFKEEEQAQKGLATIKGDDLTRFK